MAGSKKKDSLKYGEGQREQYGEGFRYRKEDVAKGTAPTDEGDGFAGGDRARKPVPDPREPEGD